MFINLTPHAINEMETGTTVQPSGTVARVTTVYADGGEIDGVPISIASYGDIIDLPDPRPGVIFIVSGMVESAVIGRNDVVAPGELVRDDDGKPIGCKGFKRTT